MLKLIFLASWILTSWIICYLIESHQCAKAFWLIILCPSCPKPEARYFLKNPSSLREQWYKNYTLGMRAVDAPKVTFFLGSFNAR